MAELVYARDRENHVIAGSTPALSTMDDEKRKKTHQKKKYKKHLRVVYKVEFHDKEHMRPSFDHEKYTESYFEGQGYASVYSRLLKKGSMRSWTPFVRKSKLKELLSQKNYAKLCNPQHTDNRFIVDYGRRKT